MFKRKSVSLLFCHTTYSLEKQNHCSLKCKCKKQLSLPSVHFKKLDIDCMVFLLQSQRNSIEEFYFIHIV